MVVPTIIYEDSDLLVLNKPAGLSVHADLFTTEPTVSDWLIEHFPAIRGVGESMRLPNGIEIERPGIVHRLDKNTSGVLVVVKTSQAFLSVKEQFQNHEIHKTYRALAYGAFKKQTDIIKYPIGRSRKDPRIRIAHGGAVGKLREAVTQYQVLENFKDYSYIELYPKTGRTHQIRVHLKAIHHPVVCDELYAPGKLCLPGLNRHALHATKLELTLLNGDRRAFEAPLPPDFEAALDHLRTTC